MNKKEVIKHNAKLFLIFAVLAILAYTCSYMLHVKAYQKIQADIDVSYGTVQKAYTEKYVPRRTTQEINEGKRKKVYYHYYLDIDNDTGERFKLEVTRYIMNTAKPGDIVKLYSYEGDYALDINDLVHKESPIFAKVLSIFSFGMGFMALAVIFGTVQNLIKYRSDNRREE